MKLTYSKKWDYIRYYVSIECFCDLELFCENADSLYGLGFIDKIKACKSESELESLIHTIIWFHLKLNPIPFETESDSRITPSNARKTVHAVPNNKIKKELKMKKIWNFMIKYDELAGSFAFVFCFFAFFILILM